MPNRTTQSSKARKKGGTRAKQKEPRPIRREVGAFVCLFLAVFTVFGCFGVKAPFINLLTQLLRGLFGGGFYVMPLSFFACFVILLLHEGRPVRLRVSCALLFGVVIGALAQVLSPRAVDSWSFAELWRSGVSGVLTGYLGRIFESLFSRIGAVVLLLAALVLVVLTCANMTVMSLIRAIRNRPRLEYELPEDEPIDTASALVNHVTQKSMQRKAARSEAQRQQAQRAASYDLPVDDPPELPKKKSLLEKPAAISPDAFLKSKVEEAKVSSRSRRMVEEEAAKAMTEPAPAPEEASAPAQEAAPALQNISRMPPLVLNEDAAREKKVKPEEAAQAAAEIAEQIAASDTEQQAMYAYPPMELLNPADGTAVDGTEEMRVNAERLSGTLRSFGIDADIINVTHGPSVTRYELRLHEGVKLSRVTNLSDDIALALGSTGIRISAIPDKISVVGIEVPNRLVSTVYVREVIDSPEFMNHKSRLAFALGKDIGGNRIIGDITKLPHLLIAGTTGSGKSVCMNSLIVSLLYKSRPDEVRLIMVDPKMVELGVYNGIPHLLIPVVTDPKKAAGALQWSVTEMMRRYRMMADAGVRDLDSYNKAAAARDDLEPMEQVVIVIDELADLMLVAAKEVEESICRVAQMGRAAGMHLVIATQRPSADVITGLMKANIPSRIAFAVASAMESRIILDATGAEKLVGKGDMLFAPLGQGKPQRVQGCFITDHEVQAVVDFIKNSSTANYSDDIMEQIDRSAEQAGKGSAATADAPTDDADELLPAAVEVILETGQASVSMLQRRLKLGYARAARIVDEMEERGYVGPFEGSKPRQLLITKEQWEQIKGGSPLIEQLEKLNPPVEEEIP